MFHFFLYIIYIYIIFLRQRVRTQLWFINDDHINILLT